MDDLIKLALQTIQKKKQAIIFCPSRASAEKTAEDISKKANDFFPDLEREVLKAVSQPTKQCRRLSHCIKKGIAFHHSGLTSKQKELIEDAFRERKIKIIAATPTLAAGLSLPAYRVIIKSLKRFSGRWGMDWIPVLEYLQMAGRAGRPEYESIGEAISIAKNETEKEEIYERYILGEPEEIYSKLAAEPILRTYLLSLIASGIIRDDTSMREFFGKTFWAHQFEDMQKLNDIMDRMLNLLEKWEFILVSGASQSTDEFTSASELAKPKTRTMRATMIGKRISELYLDPLTARQLLDRLEKYSVEKSLFSLLQMISHTLEMRPLLRLKKKDQDPIQQELINRHEELLEPEPSTYDLEYDEFLNSIKTALFFENWINEKNEEFLFEAFDIKPGEIRMKVETADWLLYAIDELCKVQDRKDIAKEIRKLRTRVKFGVKEEILALLRFKGIGRVRARTLFNNGIKDISDIKRTDLTSLSQLIGKSAATNLKIQIGEKVVAEIPKTKRKGQMSLQKY